MAGGEQSERRDLMDALAGLRPRLRRFAYGLAGTMDEADDLVQAAYERAFSRLHQWQPGTRLDSWMYRIVQSMWINQGRARRVREAHRQRTQASEEARVFEGQRALDAQLTLAAVRERLALMPEPQRAVLLLVAVEGLTYEEAAAVLEVPVGTVTSRLSRARRFLVERLGTAGSGEHR